MNKDCLNSGHLKDISLPPVVTESGKCYLKCSRCGIAYELSAEKKRVSQIPRKRINIKSNTRSGFMSYTLVSLFVFLFVPSIAFADTLTEFASKDSRFGRDACGGGPGFSILRNYSDLASTGCNVIDATEGLVKWGTSDQMYRTIEKFPTENLPDNAVVTAAEICHYYYSKNGTHNIGMTKYNGSSWTSAVSTDWGKMPNTSTGFPEGITRFSTSTITTGQYNCHSFDADGLSWVSTTGSLIVAFRGASDLDDGSTPGTFDLSWYSLSYTGTSRDPYISITYTVPGVCGDDAIDTGEGEECDDGNTSNADGCSSVCLVEDGWTCTGEPSVCEEDSGPPIPPDTGTGDLLAFGNINCDEPEYIYSGSGDVVGGYCQQYTFWIYDYPLVYLMNLLPLVGYSVVVFAFGLIVIVWTMRKLFTYLYNIMYDKPGK